jgi:cell division septation protein DedD
MKNSKEMADSVFAIRDAYTEKRNKRKNIIKKTAFAGSTFCMFVLIFAGIKQSMPEKPQTPDKSVIVETAESTVSAETSINSREKHTSSAKTTTVTSVNTTSETKSGTQTVSTSKAVETTVTDPAEENESTAEPAQEETEAPASQETVTEPDNTANTVTETVNNTQTANFYATDEESDNNNFAHVEEESLSLCQKYNTVEIGSPAIEYTSSDKTVPADMLGELLCIIDIPDTENNYSAEIYLITGYKQNEAIAVKFKGEDEYYFYGFNKLKE